YLNFLITTEGLIAIAALIQAARIVRAREARGIILLSFALLYYVFINLFNVRNDRTILPVLPFLHLLAALFIMATYDFFKANARFARRAFVAASGLIALIIIVPISNAFASDARLTQTDARDSARVWLAANLPPGARVVEEAYTPYLDTQRFVVQGLDSLIDRDADWFAQNGFEYVIAGQGMYGRFYAEPERYAQFVERYNKFFARYAEFKRFDENGVVIRVFRTNAQLPSQRVAARFGNYGEIIELVGYDASVAPRDRAGNSRAGRR
ncbi:MAG: hypothetical protein HY257_00980, partial [Chloroflexi bacterium]|nr:hypothetical protein [Chloroflexota bacterium]